MQRILAEVINANTEVDRLRRELDQATFHQNKVHEAALLAICPFASQSRRERFIPISATQAITNPVLSIAPPHVPGGLPRWVATGSQVRFRMGTMETIREGSIDGPAYDALPEHVKALTLAEMTERSREQRMTGEGKPLKLTTRQLSMFSGLSNNAFDISGKEGGQLLPSTVWDSDSSTQQIWIALIKRGVLTLVSGNLESNRNTWRVNPGPRFEEAITLLLEGDTFKRGSYAYEHAQAFFKRENMSTKQRRSRP